ncbi:MAG: preprotein translocase subunit SecG [bacterium]|nr:preprotein translocase subunit SecG [bacterium]
MITTLLYITFVLAAIVLTVVILLQEGKGGGFGDALGTAGQQTFGVKASGIHRFTAIVAVVFLSSALFIHILNRNASQSTSIDDGIEAPADQ